MKLLMCNLKANKTFLEMQEYIADLKKIKNKDNLVVFPTALFLPMFKEGDLSFGSQDVSIFSDKKSTGEVLAEQIKSIGATYTLIGHSERRIKFAEDEHIIFKKINNAIKANLNVVYCIGETKEERLRKKTYQVLEKQIARIFNNIDEKSLKNIIIAYEPVWAIGNGNPANSNDIEQIISFIKKIVLDYYNINIKVLYGGSVNSKNINEYIGIDTIDGFLIGTAAEDTQEVAKLLEIIK